MWEKIKTYSIAHLFGLLLTLVGWFMSIASTAMYIRLDRFSPVELMNGFNLFGLALILIGSYFPEAWVSFKTRGSK